jgi:nicotinate-nucleotide adenylyltransferase
MRVGILGGTFNPPHHGHLVCAQEARIQLGLDSVRLLPAGHPPHRTLEGRERATPGQRMSMVRLAAIGQPGLEVSDAELERDGVSWTVDTLSEMTAREPDTRFTLILGADQAEPFGGWREPARIAELAELAVAARDGHDQTEALGALRRAAGGGRQRAFEMPRVDISSTFVRERVRGGETIAHLVPAGVPEFIEQAGLYR